MRISVRAPGVSTERLAHLVEHLDRQAGQDGDPRAQRLGEVQLPVHRRGGDAGDLGGAAGAGGELVDDLAAHERGVDVEHDQPLAAPGEPDLLHRDVRAGGRRDRARAPVRSAVASAPETVSSKLVTG